MGRPDTLGIDLYHNRHYPQIHDEFPASPNLNSKQFELPQCAIIKCMVDFSRLTRTVCLGLYMSSSPPQQCLTLAQQIEKNLDNWLNELPPSIRPSRTYESERSLKAIKDARWMKRQRLVVSISIHALFVAPKCRQAEIGRVSQCENALICLLPDGGRTDGASVS